MEVATNNCLPFIGTEIINTGQHLETCVFRKNTNKDLLLHFQSHGDGRLKRPLLKTMLDRAKRLSSTQDFFLQECNTLKGIFLKLKYPKKVIESAINSAQHPRDMNYTPTDSPLRITWPYKDQKSAGQLGRQLGDLGRKINHTFAANLYKQNVHRQSTRNGIKAYASEPAECYLWIQMWFVWCKLYRLHRPSPPSARRGTQTFRYLQAFLWKNTT